MTLLPLLHRLVVGLVRRTWLVALVTLAVCAVFAAHAVAALLEPEESPISHLGSIAVTARPESASSARAHDPRAEARERLAKADALVERNMFCSDCAPVRVGSGPADPSSTFRPDAILIATSVGATATLSQATIRATATGHEAQGSWGVGETIGGVGTIVRIGYASVDVRDADGRTGTLSLLASGGDATAAATAVASTAPATANPENPWADHVRKIDDHTYDVERQIVRDLVTGATTGKGGIRATPNLVNGELAGIRLLTVRPDSAPAAIGLRTGDTISSVDGDTIKNAQQMIDLYGKIDKLNGVELGGTRGGKPFKLQLNLR